MHPNLYQPRIPLLMKKTETLMLIDGSFTIDEAKEIVVNIIFSKIIFHNVKNLSSQERFGKDDEIAKKEFMH